MKQTLLDIQSAYATASMVGREPTSAELGAIIEKRLPEGREERLIYLGQAGEFIGQALAGVVIYPEKWKP